MSTDKFEPETFTLYTGSKPRAQELDRLAMFCGDLPLEDVYRVVVRKGEEGRRQLQNRLYQSIIGQVSKQMRDRSDDENDFDESVVAGKLKFHLLLPMKRSMAAEFADDALMEQAQFERHLCDAIAQSDKIAVDDLYRAYDRAIRSKTLHVKPFARYMDRLIEKLTMQGFVIRLKPSEQARALGSEQQQAVAA